MTQPDRRSPRPSVVLLCFGESRLGSCAVPAPERAVSGLCVMTFRPSGIWACSSVIHPCLCLFSGALCPRPRPRRTPLHLMRARGIPVGMRWSRPCAARLEYFLLSSSPRGYPIASIVHPSRADRTLGVSTRSPTHMATHTQQTTRSFPFSRSAPPPASPISILLVLFIRLVALWIANVP